MPDSSFADHSSPERPARRSRYRLARGASPWLLPSTAVTAALTVAACRTRAARWAVPAVSALALSTAMVSFFRDPERTPGPEGRLLAPADGVVQGVEAWPDGRTRIATFMSPLNVHVNRAPTAGSVTSVEHLPGGYLPAFDKDSDRNERVVWHFDTELGDLEMVQIAGAVARRIVPYIREGGKVERGERIGLIRFGSRVDVYLPAGTQPGVEVGQRLTAGESTLDRY